jgi:amidohydrolase family protein
MAALPKALIDVHCHVFNATDLPAITFINTVVRERYGQDPDGLMPGIGFLIDVLAGNAPRAADELADLQGKPRPPFNAALNGGAIAANGGPQNGAQADDETKSGLFAWLHLFGLSRRDLIARLASHYSATGKRCVLMAPALVDYNAWLKHPDAEYRRLDDQVAVMGAIARQKGPVRVHGFVGFDPIRAILAAAGRNPVNEGPFEPIDPHQLLRRAVTKHGFLGAKLYPPMGFRAWHNDAPDMTFPPHIKQYITNSLDPDGISDAAVGKAIDQQLAKLYTYCAKNGVPILAHGYNSNQAGQCFGWRASPQYWREVIQKFSSKEKPLRVCLAHFGRFNAHQVNTQCISGGIMGEVWETIFGSILTEPGSEHVYADLSYFAEMLDRTEGWKERRKKLRDKLRKYLDKHDPEVEHICYGSDWVMLGLERGNERYHEELGAFLSEDVGLSQKQLGRVFFGNAVRFLGLGPDDQNRERLEKFYQDNNIKALFPKLGAQV